MAKAKKYVWKKMTLRDIILGALFTVVVAVTVTEHIAYEDSWTCRAENLDSIYAGLATYLYNYPGQFLQTPEKVKTFVAGINQGSSLQFCNVTREPFVWFPSDLKNQDGVRVIVMCPPQSHGWLRKFAWGLAEKDGKIVWLRIKKDKSFTIAN